MPKGNPEAYQAEAYLGGPDNKGFDSFGQWWKALQGPTGVQAPPAAPSPAGEMDLEGLFGDEMPIQGGSTPTWRDPDRLEAVEAPDWEQANAPGTTPGQSVAALASAVPPRKPFYIDESVPPLSAIANLQSPPPAPREDPLSAIAEMETPETSALLQWLKGILSTKAATPDGSADSKSNARIRELIARSQGQSIPTTPSQTNFRPTGQGDVT